MHQITSVRLQSQFWNWSFYCLCLVTTCFTFSLYLWASFFFVYLSYEKSYNYCFFSRGALQKNALSIYSNTEIYLLFKTKQKFHPQETIQTKCVIHIPGVSLNRNTMIDFSLACLRIFKFPFTGIRKNFRPMIQWFLHWNIVFICSWASLTFSLVVFHNCIVPKKFQE